MLKRIITGAIMLACLFPLIIIQNIYVEIAYCILGMFMTFMGTFEFTNALYKNNNNLKPFRFIIPMFSSMLAFLVFNATYNLTNAYYQFIAMLFYIFVIVIILVMMIFVKNSSITDIGSLVLAFTYGGLLFSYALSLRYFTSNNLSLIGAKLNGRQSIMYVYTIVLITDTFAYLVGSKWGKRKLCPSISPHKSFEGAIGGAVFGTVVGVLILFLYKIINMPDSTGLLILFICIGILLSFVISCTVQIGDLVESKFKRSLGIKDFGKILPGHGGMLDRFDSFILSGSLFYIFLMFIEFVILG